MPVTVKTSRRLEMQRRTVVGARRTLSRAARVMRAPLEGDVSISTIVRATDHTLTQLDIAGPRITIGAGVTFRASLPSATAFLHPVAGSIGGPAVRNMGTTAAICLRQIHSAISLSPCSHSMQRWRCRAVMGRATCRLRIPCRAGSAAGGLVLSVSLRRPFDGEAFRYRRSRASGRRARGGDARRASSDQRGRTSARALRSARWRRRPSAPKGPERAIEGRALDAASIGAAVTAVTEGTSPVYDSLASAWYRRESSAVHLRRLLGGQQ